MQTKYKMSTKHKAQISDIAKVGMTRLAPVQTSHTPRIHARSSHLSLNKYLLPLDKSKLKNPAKWRHVTSATSPSKSLPDKILSWGWLGCVIDYLKVLN